MGFDAFRKTNGPPRNCARPTDLALKEHETKVDADLLEEWKNNGWCTYANGVIWFVNPDEFKDVLAEWLPGRALTVVLRTAFGDLVLVGDGQVYYLHVHYGRLISVATVLRRYLNATVTKKYVGGVMNGSLTAKAVKKLGALQPDEVFTFEPALALGGASEIKYVTKVKIFPHLSFLAQLHGKVTNE
jgi:hypothetical protein